MAEKTDGINWWVQLSIAVVPAALVLAGTIWGTSLTYENKDREMDIRLVEIALSILKGEATESSLPARTYAIELLKTYPDTLDGIEQGVWEAWIKGGDVPFNSVKLGWESVLGTGVYNCYFASNEPGKTELCAELFKRPGAPSLANPPAPTPP